MRKDPGITIVTRIEKGASSVEYVSPMAVQIIGMSETPVEESKINVPCMAAFEAA